MSMQSGWIERIFTRMLARYGSAWINMWAGVDASAMIEDWERVLLGVPSHMIIYGLDNLPDRPPNSTQFKAICVQHPERAPLAIEAPPADPERVAAELSKMFAMNRKHGDMKQWARALQEREANHGGVLKSGKRMTAAQHTMWRAALDPHSVGIAEMSESLRATGDIPEPNIP